MTMIARVARAKVFSEATETDLETAMNTWFAAAGEIKLLEVHFSADTTFSALVLYTQ